MKKIKILLCITACLFALNGCSILAESKPVDTETQQVLLDKADLFLSTYYTAITDQNYADMIRAMSPEECQMQLESVNVYADGNAYLAGFESWMKASEQLGNVTILDRKVEYGSKESTIIATITVQGDKLNSENKPREAEVEFVFENNFFKTLTSSATNVTLTFGEKMENAGLNTLIGMGTVFAILILLCLIISCFGIFPKIEAMKKEKQNKENASIDQPIAQIIEKEEMTGADDLELVAVITAAIHAYESAQGTPVSTDDFVVRSIKRRR
ncbi:MAG: OadG family protein [Lachnospiraceae bacterium]|nr:OadG family protein [Lachnospiraceae bacterium]